ncbi:hypothetical protein SK128_009490, partial [Halocaridina rubra]
KYNTTVRNVGLYADGNTEGRDVDLKGGITRDFIGTDLSQPKSNLRPLKNSICFWVQICLPSIAPFATEARPFPKAPYFTWTREIPLKAPFVVGSGLP